MTTIPNANLENPTTKTRAMSALERVTSKTPETPPSAKVDIPDSVPTTPVHTMKGETPTDEKDDFTPEIEAPPSVNDVAPSLDEIDMLIDPKGTSAENFKKLRTKLKTINTEYKTASQELETLRKKVSDYDTGLATPAQLQEYQDRIQALEVYEKMYNLKTSPAYVEAIAKPLQETKTKLIELAKDYEVDLTVLDEALSITNRAELNRLLTNHFDEVGALEVKSLLGKMQEINNKAAEADKEPSIALQRLNAQTEQSMQAKRQMEIDEITTTSKSAWVESLTSLREEDHVGLSFRDGDTEHNETIARPILNKAGRDYGVVVKALAEQGLKTLPKEVSYVIARSIQLAHESAYLRHQNEQMKTELVTLRQRVGNLNNLNRPNANGFRSNSSPVGDTREKGGVGAARAALARATASK